METNYQLQFLGRGSAFNTKEGNTAAFYEDKDRNALLLIDCGSSVFSKIMELNLLNEVKHLHIAITHLHADHAGSLADLILYSHWILGITPIVFYPIPEDLKTFLLLQGVCGKCRDEIGGDKPQQYMIGFESDYLHGVDMRIHFKGVDHVLPLKGKSFSLRLEFVEASNIFYSGDCSSIDFDAFADLEKGEFQRMYHEVHSEDSPAHVSYRMLRMFDHSLREKIWLMHFDAGFDKERAKKDGFNIVEVVREKGNTILTNTLKSEGNSFRFFGIGFFG